MLSVAELLPLLQGHLVDVLTDARLPCAARVARAATTREDWSDVLAEAQGSSMPGLADVARACTALMDGQVEAAAELMADAENLTLEQWVTAMQVDRDAAAAEEAPAPPPSAAILVEQVDVVRGDLRRVVDLVVRCAPKTTSDLALRYLQGDTRDLRHNLRMMERDLDRMQRLVASMWRADELAAAHEAQAARRAPLTAGRS